jgi:two-component system, NtrC family, sensor kinase
MNPPIHSILVIDDIPANIRVLFELLTQANFKVAVAKDGESGLEISKEAMPDLILLDVLMPGIDGFETCRRLKAEPLTQDIPVIFMTALSEVADKVKGFQAGAVDYITKPIEQAETLARINVHLALRQAQRKLIEEEKMASLGQLVAGIAHEINTPLGAIQASISNATAALDQSLQQLPQLFQTLSPERLTDFYTLLNIAQQAKELVSFREERQIKRSLTQDLQARGLENAVSTADTLSRIGISNELEALMPLIQSADSDRILDAVYNLSTIQRNSQNIKLAVERAAKIVFALKSYARQDIFNQVIQASITDGIDMILTLYQGQLKRGVEVTKTYEATPLIFCYPDELTQVWSNLISNAIQAMQYKGNLAIAVFEQSEPDGQNRQIVVQITDSGPGIDPKIQEKIFDPFFTTKPMGEGSGLGLNIVRKIIDKHQGTIQVDSNPGYTVFQVNLPTNLQEKTERP